MKAAQITVVLGPTASGKSQHAIDLALKQGAEIISADALQVYKGLDIGTAKTPLQERQNIPHHLIDIKSIHEHYSAAEFISRTEIILQDLLNRNIPVIICGGTALYQMAFLYHYQFPENAKSSPQTLCSDEDTVILWEQLNQIDPKRASEIHPNNKVRILRALDIQKMNQAAPSTQSSKADQIRSDVTIQLFFPNRETLYQRINQRVDLMIKDGWIDEAKSLFEQYPIDSPGFKAIGYSEIYDYLHHAQDYHQMIERIKQKTRHFAKRQYTWYRKLETHENVQLL